MKIQRQLLSQLRQAIQPGKVVVLHGPRQVGKTTLVQDLLAETSLAHTYINDADAVQCIARLWAAKIAAPWAICWVTSALLVIDEAQRVPDIGLNLKILVDSYPQVAIVATGSSSFDLANKVSEPLTGRKLTLTLYPASYSEMAETVGRRSRLAPSSRSAG